MNLFEHEARQLLQLNAVFNDHFRRVLPLRRAGEVPSIPSITRLKKHAQIYSYTTLHRCTSYRKTLCNVQIHRTRRPIRRRNSDKFSYCCTHAARLARLSSIRLGALAASSRRVFLVGFLCPCLPHARARWCTRRRCKHQHTWTSCAGTVCRLVWAMTA